MPKFDSNATWNIIIMICVTCTFNLCRAKLTTQDNVIDWWNIGNTFIAPLFTEKMGENTCIHEALNG